MLDYALLDALGAVVRLGSFDRAARELNVTPSAVSQRVKLLEERVGSVLVKRGQPCFATPPGALLCRHIERVQRLETELGEHLPPLPGMLAESWPTFRVAVNDDSVGTWFIDAISGLCAERKNCLTWLSMIRNTRRSNCAKAACKAPSLPRPSRCRVVAQPS